MQDKSIERARKHYKCPYCNSEVTTIHLGELWGRRATEFNEIKKQENLKITTFGVIFGDDRDPIYVCDNCKREFDENMELIDNTRVGERG